MIKSRINKIKVANEKLQAITDEEQITAFGITREERQLKQKLAKTDEEQDWDKYDVPPKMRWSSADVATNLI